MAIRPASPDPGRDDTPAGRAGEPDQPGKGPEGWRELPASREDWLTEDEWVAWLSEIEPEEWAGPSEDDEPDDGTGGHTAKGTGARGGRDAKGADCASKTGRIPKGAARASRGGRRGPGQPGSISRAPGASAGPVGAFAAGHTLDVAPGGAGLLGLAENAAGPDDRFPGTTDDELTGIICALDRSEATASALKHAAIAEFIRRRPDAAREPALADPRSWEEFTGTELSHALADTRWAAELMLDLSQSLATKLPGTYAAFRAGVLRESKVAIIARAVANLDPAEARAAEVKVLDRAGQLTPGGLRRAIVQAVIEVAPDKAKKRREEAAQNARVERWPEPSGNAGLAGRELPPADVLAADQRISWWAKELKKAGLEGDMDELRARAYMDIILGRDSRRLGPAGSGGTRQDGSPGGDGTGGGGDGLGGDSDGGSGSGDGELVPPSPDGTGIPPTAGVIPAGFAGRINLTVTLPTLLNLADRPGEISGIGPIDPALARDLAGAAATNPKTTWCVTVTDEQGHAIGHGCARPEPRNQRPLGPDPPDGTPTPRFTFTASGQDGPDGGYGVWRLATGVPGQRDLIITLDPIALDTCDHRFEARGHDPGVKLRHLSQIRHATCTGPTCRRPAAGCDFEHNIPFENGGRTCLCNGGPKCRLEHRLKQDPRWNVEQITPGTFRWTVPSGRQYTTEPTRYPI